MIFTSVEHPQQGLVSCQLVFKTNSRCSECLYLFSFLFFEKCMNTQAVHGKVLRSVMHHTLRSIPVSFRWDSYKNMSAACGNDLGNCSQLDFESF